MGVIVRERKETCRFLAVGLLTLLFSLSMAVTALGGQLEDAQAAYERDDYATAYRLYKPLAEQGDASSQFKLGIMYHNGRGVPKDNAEAAKWYRKAAEQGDAQAQFNLGQMYREGKGVLQDYAEAVKWYRKAAEQGDAQAQYNLGTMYFNRQGVSPDYVLAHMWFNLAASRFPASEGEHRDMAVRNRDRVASEMTPAQIAEAQRLAREWKPKKEGK